MEERGREHEARRIGGAGRLERHLAAVGAAMEDRKQRDDAHGDHDRRAARERYDPAEHDHGGGDAQLDERQRHAGHAERGAGRHGEDEASRHEPERAPPELPGKDADRHHRQNVVEPAERMGKARYKTVRFTGAGMREGGSGDERKCGGDQAGAHGRPLVGEQNHRSKNCTSAACSARARAARRRRLH